MATRMKSAPMNKKSAITTHKPSMKTALGKKREGTTLPAVKTTRSQIAKKSSPEIASEKSKEIIIPAVKKTKLVRDSYTIPKIEFLALQKLKQRAAGLAKPAKKSELLRAGLLALEAMSDLVFLDTLAKVAPLKTGRPKIIKK